MNEYEQPDAPHEKEEVYTTARKGSWWLDLPSREAFEQAARKEAIRLRLSRVWVEGASRVVGSVHGR